VVLPVLLDRDAVRHRTILHRYVQKFTAATPFRKADLTARWAKITHAALRMPISCRIAL